MKRGDEWRGTGGGWERGTNEWARALGKKYRGITRGKSRESERTEKICSDKDRGSRVVSTSGC